MVMVVERAYVQRGDLVLVGVELGLVVEVGESHLQVHAHHSHPHSHSHLHISTGQRRPPLDDR
jgi:hypothetical protein